MATRPDRPGDVTDSPPDGVRPPRPALRWGLGDFFVALVAGLVGATLAVLPFVSSDGTVHDRVPALIASLAGQSLATLAALVVVSRRKGRGSLSADFGFALDPRDAQWLIVGVALELVAGIALLPITEITGKGTSQQVVRQFEHAHGANLALFALGVVVVAPIVEELLYRGLLLRSLLRRMPPTWAVSVAALAFGLAHVLGDSGSYPALPALVALGALSGVMAVRTGRISRSILLHAGFNLLTAVLLLAH